MLDLGLLHDQAELQKLAEAPKLPEPHPRHEAKRRRVKEPQEPTRKLEPRHAKAPNGSGGAAAAAAAAAGEPGGGVQTPRRQLPTAGSRSRQHQAHPPAADDEGAAGGRHGSEEEDAVGNRAAQQAKKLRELEVQGLAAFDEDSATFNVCGSTGNTYTVTLSNGKPHCSCPDHRFRRHDCKHIKLVLAKLRIQRRPKDWFEAVQRLSTSGDSVTGRLDAAEAAQAAEAEAVEAVTEVTAAADTQQGAAQPATPDVAGNPGSSGRARAARGGRSQQRRGAKDGSARPRRKANGNNSESGEA
ncbi:hypothetical protein CHLRE_11g467743v5 [Chlamydomonas reinhardtii]|uniref:SWIM-type domain-containing protein n=1 Tax=Chlamydomonas reinhardtii TaxID=3055 RepID=A0A2K3D7W5_CHLRE|nr:uncharacterized protein CHLRE_11g467743v5 [Chlamydomonas reinhardtii]PNW76622.1 hypothetical protein CHLRE_11g467743v5 [Chlamydomonas reinhardtii]